MSTMDTHTDPRVIRRALTYLHVLKKREREYREEVVTWYRSGDGRNPRWIDEVEEIDGEIHVRRINVGGSGYRFPHCIHGASAWTDYDNICGACEDGASVYELALGYAHADIREMDKRIDVCATAYGAGMRGSLYSKLVDWAMVPIGDPWPNLEDN